MSEPSQPGSAAFSSAQIRRVDQVCTQFERAWKGPGRPRIEDFIDLAPEPDRSVVLRELIRLEVEYRRACGEDCRAEDYQGRFPLLDPAWLAGALESRATATPDRSSASTPESAFKGLPAEPPTIPGYEMLGLLGCGGMAVVYKAWQVGLKRLVALKMLLNPAGATARDLARFAIEAEAVARLQHPHIVHIYEIGECSGLPYFTLELLDGGSLDKRLGGVPLPARQAAQLVESLARAVHYAHQRGIVHRDLKPANVLLTAAGIPKISDFGLAKLTVGAGVGQTQSGAIVGTPSYMAPEQAGGKIKEVGPAADIYALGAILYETLTGRPPFRAETTLGTLQQVQTEEPVSVVRLQPKVPPDLNTICLKCLQKEPSQRYASAEALAEDLHRFRAGEPIQARAIGTWERSIKWAKRRPALAALLVVSSVGLLSLIGLMAAWWRDAEARAVAVQQLGTAKSLLQTLEQEAEEKRAEVHSLAKSIEQEREQVRSAQVEKRRAFYIRDIQLADMALEKGQVGRLITLLERHRPSSREPDQEDVRGWEWHYLWRLCHRERFRLSGHQHLVPLVQFASDGKRLVTCDVEGTGKLWDVADGKELATPPSLAGRVYPMAFTLDGKTLATGGEDGIVRLWDSDTGQLKDTFQALNQAKIYGLGLAPDGKMLAIASEDKTIKLWDVATRKERRILPGHGRPALFLKFSPDGKKLATITDYDPRAKLWDVATGKEERIITGKEGAWVTGLAFSPDGKILATAEAYPFNKLLAGSVRLWDLATGKEQSAFPVPDGGAWSVAFSPDGKTLASGSSFEGHVKLWEVTTGRVRNTFYEFLGRVYSLAFSPDGKTLASGSDDHTVRLWDATARPSPGILRGHTAPVSGVAFSPDQKTIASASHDQTVKLWDPVTGQEKGSLQGQRGWINAVAFSPDGKMIATANEDSTVQLWSPGTMKVLATLPGHRGKVASVAFSPDGKTVASAGRDGTVRLWDLDTCKVRAILEHTLPEVWSVAFAPDGKTLASISVGRNDSRVTLWDPASAQKRGTMPGEPGLILVTSVTFSPDSKLVAAGDWYHAKVRLFEAATGKEVATFRGHTGSVLPVAFTRDGKTIVSGSADTTVKLWDVATEQERFTLRGHANTVTATVFSPDGTMLATGSGDGTVRLWDAAPEGGPERALQAAPSSPEEDAAWHRREAKDAENTRQWFAAVWHLDRLIAAQPADGLLRLDRARAYAGLGQYGKAVAECTRVIELRPRDQDGWYNRGRAYAALGDFAKALDDYAKALELAPQEGAVWLARSFAHAKLGQQDTATEAYRQALEQSKVIRLQAATVWYRRTRIAEGSSQRSWQEVAADFTRALEAGTAEWWLWRCRGLAYAALGQWDKAAADFGRAANRKPDDPEVWRGLGRAHAEIDQWDKAAEAWSKALALKPDEWSVWHLRGLFHEAHAHQYAAAIDDYSKALELGIDAWRVRYRRGFAYAELGQWDKAAADFAMVPWMEPREVSPPAWQMHALVLLAAGDTDAYRHLCARLLEHFGRAENDLTVNHVTWACALGPSAVVDINRCIRLAEKAVAHQPNYHFLNWLGALLYRAGRFEEAIQRLNQALESHGNGATAKSWLFLAMAQHRLGRVEDARRTLDKVIPWGEPARPGQLHDTVDRFEYQLLRREAEELIKGGKP